LAYIFVLCAARKDFIANNHKGSGVDTRFCHEDSIA
jgi:hypothetical protein